MAINSWIVALNFTFWKFLEHSVMVRKEVWEEKFKVRKSGRYDSYIYYWTEAQYKVWNVDDFNVRWYLRSLLLCKWNSGIMSIKSRMLFNILSLFWSIVATIMSKYVLSSLIGISNVHELNSTWNLNHSWFLIRNHSHFNTSGFRFQMHNSA